MTLPPTVNTLVTAIQAATGSGAAPAAGTTASSTAATSTSQLVTFTGYLGDKIRWPSGEEWRLLYLDLQMDAWLLIEESGIVEADDVRDDTSPTGRCDLIWVKADAAVGVGRGSQSDEARFLTGQFTRAGDSDASWNGGTHTASTGVFCGASTVSCCRRISN
jgi:hypothetical protein